MTYTTAADISCDEAIRTSDHKIVEMSIWIIKKAIDFCNDYGYEVAARTYRAKLNDIQNIASDDTGNIDTIDLPDGNGNIVPFRILDITEYKHKKYAILAPASIEVINREALLILQLKENSNGGLKHVGITKPSLMEKIYEAF